MTCLKFVLFAVLSLVLLASPEAFAAKQKKPKVEAPSKTIYEAPMRVVVVRNSLVACEPACPEWISAEGEITDATPAVFRRVFKQLGSKNLPLVIRSPGGSINAAIDIGNMVRKRKMTVAVGYTLYRGCKPDDKACVLPKEAKGVYDGVVMEYDAFCNSACPLILSGGTTRLAAAPTWVGLHQPKTEWSREWVRWRETYRIVNGKKKVLKHTIISRKIVKGKTTYGLHKGLRKKLTGYYKAMGIDLAILGEMERAKYEDMYWLPDSGKDKLRLRTSAVSAMQLGTLNGAKADVRGIETCEIKGAKYVGAICSEQLKVAASQASKVTDMSARLARLDDPRCGAKCPSWIVLEGRITAQSSDLFESFVKTLDLKPAIIVLNSSGGDLDGAFRLGRTIRRLGFETAIGKTTAAEATQDSGLEFKALVPKFGFCRGSCLMAYVGGKQRHIDVGTDLQVQAPFNDVAAGKVQLQQNQMERHVDFLGADGAFFHNLPRFLDTTGQGVKASHLLDFRIATDTQYTSFLFDWTQGDLAQKN